MANMSYNNPPQYQQQGFPQQQQGFPQQQQGFPQQQQGLPQQQQGLPQQQRGLPQQQQGLPQQQKGLPPQQQELSPQGYFPQQGFPSQQQGFPQQQQMFVPKQQGIPPEQQGVYVQGGIPPQFPPQQPIMYAATNQMNPQVMITKEARREWRFGLFDCFADSSLCLKTWCCPCITYGENKEKISNSPGSCATHALIFCCVEYCLGLGCLLGAMTRNEARNRYQIEGTGLGDFCTHFCCSCCALIQENREANSLP
ncbi:16777_t:CDS:2 [Funneliformis mosseae]|uniref:16777_t:CDS:1 n=1 Tax=Funneliformis mosseae TaxID=27381 RepID=A0A9N8YU78_FUNMO|nr:16777_t:CDS:2 [Funneliformis mosseae]